jgi:ribosomal protein S18 acetylase RimI-like enzyme
MTESVDHISRATDPVPSEIRPPVAEDVAAFTRLIWQHQISILGMRDQPFLRAVVVDATKDSRTSIVIAEAHGEIVGWSIAIVNPQAYWRGFLVRHPILGGRALYRRQFGLADARGKSVRSDDSDSMHRNEVQWPRSPDVRWGTSSDTVAKHLDLTVCGHVRRMGIGRRLQQAHFSSLGNRGVERVDAVVSRTNTASIRLHIEQGWSLVKTDERTYYITKYLSN